MVKQEKHRLLNSILFPALFVVVLWLVKGIDILFNLDLNQYGLYPLRIRGLPGILISPFLHANLSHLFANSIPLFLLSAFLFYFYEEISWMILILIYLITGFLVWVYARGDAVHVGASGVIYGLASFLFLSGIIRKEKGLMVLTLLVTFLYGGLIWGIFPQFFPNQPISWESHLMGLLAGIILALYYKNSGPQKKEWIWEEEENESDDNSWKDPQIDTDPPKD
ncbi:MAG: rhomboid family intramembrane serine protease [Bacteroidales bacterium]|nr:rhomboid family intramembrane serine protease [Bacteroidales bacterium]HNW73291.1 rhomboid family intramembrane serine protease [Bacteroidales bacterium]HPS50376.1 rhomboid family intramembrane serine protease [Bacteroidales bacterium]